MPDNITQDIGLLIPGSVQHFDERSGIAPPTKSEDERAFSQAMAADETHLVRADLEEKLNMALKDYRVFRESSGKELSPDDTVIYHGNGEFSDFYVLPSSGFSSFDEFLGGETMLFVDSREYLEKGTSLFNDRFKVSTENGKTKIVSRESSKQGSGGTKVTWYFELDIKKKRLDELNGRKYTVRGNHVFYKQHLSERMAQLELKQYNILEEAGNNVAHAELDPNDKRTLIVKFAGLMHDFDLDGGIRKGKQDELKLGVYEDAIKQHAQRWRIMNNGKKLSDEELDYSRDMRWVTRLVKRFYSHPSQGIDNWSEEEIIENTNKEILGDIRENFDAYRMMYAFQFPAADHQFKEVFTRLVTEKKNRYMEKFGGIVTDEYMGNIAFNYDYSEYAGIDESLPKHLPLEKRAYLKVSNISTTRFDFDNPQMNLQQADLAFMLNTPWNDLPKEKVDGLIGLCMDELGIKAEDREEYLKALDFAKFERLSTWSGRYIGIDNLQDAEYFWSLAYRALNKITDNSSDYWIKEEQGEYLARNKTTVAADINYLRHCITDNYKRAYSQASALKPDKQVVNA